MMDEKQKAAVPDPDFLIEAVLESRTASNWLKQALRDCLKRDCVDASRDAETLAYVLDARARKYIAIHHGPLARN